MVVLLCITIICRCFWNINMLLKMIRLEDKNTSKQKPRHQLNRVLGSKQKMVLLEQLLHLPIADGP